MAVRPRIRELIDNGIQKFVGSKDTQNITFPYKLNAEETADRNSKINEARAAVDSDDYGRMNIRVYKQDVSTTNPVPVTDVHFTQLQSLLRQIEENTAQLEIIIGDVDV